MPRIYIRKTNRQNWPEEQMQKALDAVRDDLTLEKISSEATDLRTMETSEASTSKVGQHMQNFALPKKRVKRVAVTPGEHALYKRLVKVGVKLSKCRSKVKIQASKIKALQNITTNPKFLEILDALPSTSKILTLLQFREIKKGDRGRRFTLQEKLVSLSIMKQSSKGYRFLRKIFILPSRQILLQLLHQANIKPGINSNTIEQLKKATEAMKLEDKLCILLFDEMSLKPSVAYNERKDRVCGFVTNGDEVYSEYADHAQVFMIRGLLKNYKQPVAYTFSQAATKGPELAKQLKAVVTALQGAGLTVVATVCDQGTNNVSCIKYLLQETRGILLRRGEEPKHNLILVNNQEIIPLYDPPHLIKCVRNNLISKHLKYVKDGETKVAKWAHIMLLHKENPGYKGIRLVPKLTDAHCDPNKIPKMKVKFATQLFSQTVASNMGYLADKGILPADAKDTADILLFFDQLFDAMNGSHGKKKKYGKPLLGPATPTSIHMKVWRESKNMLQKMKFLNRSTLRDEYVPTLNNWVWTLDGTELLLKTLHSKYGVTSVWLRHLNQDPIENFFGCIRSHGCRNVNPTPEKFETAFTTLLVNSLSSVHAPGANCQGDDCYALHEVLITGRGSKEQINCELNTIPDITITPLEDKKDPREIGGLQYVSGKKSKKPQILSNILIQPGSSYHIDLADECSETKQRLSHTLTSDIGLHESDSFWTRVSTDCENIAPAVMNEVFSKIVDSKESTEEDTEPATSAPLKKLSSPTSIILTSPDRLEEYSSPILEQLENLSPFKSSDYVSDSSEDGTIIVAGGKKMRLPNGKSRRTKLNDQYLYHALMTIHLSDAKFKEGIFTGPDVRKLIKDTEFAKVMTNLERNALKMSYLSF
ncbi:unnamed protein product [Arctia plantaginis]|uniref:Transposase n=1 Tax=Arctia plantaginis TaxID=874455 RepID=A0A8S0YTH2_ARCPL|nr:unnamed protein product [Arctia plantaginis]